MNLNLENWILLHIRVHIIIVLIPVDSGYSHLKHFDVVDGVISKDSNEHLIESLKMLHLNLEEVLTPLDVTLELLSVYECILYLCFLHKVHEFVFSLNETVGIVVATVIGIDKILVCAVNLLSFKHLVFW